MIAPAEISQSMIRGESSSSRPMRRNISARIRSAAPSGMVETQRIGRVSSEWFSLPVDNRFLSALGAPSRRTGSVSGDDPHPTPIPRRSVGVGKGVRILLQAVRAAEKGSTRKRLPVAAKMALATAGPIGATSGSPTPVGASVEGTIWTSTFGMSSMRKTW